MALCRGMSTCQSAVAVLDDEPQMRTALTRLLRTHGLQVEAYGTGEELLASLANHSPSCLLLDLHMPGLTGFDVLEALAAAKRTLPVIVLTGHDKAGNQERVSALGAVAYLLKPLDESALLAAILKATALKPLVT